MKKFTLLPLFALGFILFNACKSEPPPPPVPLVERNPEVRKYIDVLTDLVNEYCTLVEESVTKAQELKEKQEAGEVGFFDGLDMVSSVATSAIKIKTLSDEIEEMAADKATFEKELSDADFKEFLGLYTTTLTCFYELAERAKELED
jgi:hypothetical protein